MKARLKKSKSTKPQPFVQKMAISPEMARDWLENCNVINQRLNENHIDCLARDMQSGKWLLTHEGIAFDSRGFLIDGQHRLWAILMSDVTVEMYVWRNIDPHARIAIDCGKKRSMADILTIAGKNGDVSKEQVAVLRVMLGGISEVPRLSSSEMSYALNVYEEAIDFAIENLPNTFMARGVNTAVVRAVIARAYYTVDAAVLEDFCHKLTTGIIISDDESVIVLLRLQLQTLRDGNFTARMRRYCKTEQVLMEWLCGENPSIVTSADTELFPLLEEMVEA